MVLNSVHVGIVLQTETEVKYPISVHLINYALAVSPFGFTKNPLTLSPVEAEALS
jgi:hypothetical protein